MANGAVTAAGPIEPRQHTMRRGVPFRASLQKENRSSHWSFDQAPK